MGSNTSNVGKKNAYRCQKCNGVIVTMDVDAGITPFMIECRNWRVPECTGYMYSMFYNVNQEIGAHWGWLL